MKNGFVDSVRSAVTSVTSLFKREDRFIVEVSFDKAAGLWMVKSGKVGRKVPMSNGFQRKRDAVTFGVLECRSIRENGGTAQLRVKRADGRYQFERTYGEDPRKSKG